MWAGAMMMQHLGFEQMHDTLIQAMASVLAEGKALTRDMGGSATMLELGEAVMEVIEH
nr:isocitrate/isopropylmalate family dehydrogenase [uncultured Amphritea sp.]